MKDTTEDSSQELSNNTEKRNRTLLSHYQSYGHMKMYIYKKNVSKYFEIVLMCKSKKVINKTQFTELFLKKKKLDSNYRVRSMDT